MQAAALAASAILPVCRHLFFEASAHALAVSPGARFLEHLDVGGEILADPLQVQQVSVSPSGPEPGIE